MTSKYTIPMTTHMNTHHNQRHFQNQTPRPPNPKYTPKTQFQQINNPQVEQISMMKPKALTPHEDGLLEYLEVSKFIHIYHPKTLY